VNRYVLGEDAELDLDDIWEYIARDSIEAADRWISKLYDAFEALSRTPGMGHVRADWAEAEVRFWAVGAYLIIYRTQADRIEIVTITQGSRDIPSFLRRRTDQS